MENLPECIELYASPHFSCHNEYLLRSQASYAQQPAKIWDHTAARINAVQF